MTIDLSPDYLREVAYSLHIEAGISAGAASRQREMIVRERARPRRADEIAQEQESDRDAATEKLLDAAAVTETVAIRFGDAALIIKALSENPRALAALKRSMK